jgi:hypothetical protein
MIIETPMQQTQMGIIERIKARIRKGFLPVICFVIPFSIILATLSMNDLSLIDHGTNILVSQAINDRGFSESFRALGDSGRFFPAYFWYPGLVYRVFGASPEAHYMAFAFVLLVTCFMAFRISLFTTGSLTWASVSVPLLLLSSSFSENFYGVGKAECLCVLYLSIAIWFFLKEQASHSSDTFYTVFVRPSAITFLLTLCFLTKETTLIVPFLALLIWVCESLFVKFNRSSTSLRGSLVLFFASIPAVIIFWVLRSYHKIPAIHQGQYTQHMDLSFSKFWQIFLDYVSKCPDIFIEAFLLLIIVALLFVRCSRVSQLEIPLKQMIALSLFGFGFWGVYLFWPRTETYFFWIGHFFFTVALLLGLALTQRSFTQNRFRRGLKISVFSFLVAILVLSRGLGGLVAQNQARSLVNWNRLNGDFLRFLSAHIPHGSRIVFWNYDFPHELIYESELQLHQIFDRRDLNIVGLGGGLEKRSFLFQPGDYLVVNYGQFPPSQVTFRGPVQYPKAVVQVFLTNMSYLLSPLNEIGSRWSLFDPISLSFGTFVSGWEIFEIEKPGPVRHCDLSVDGWMGRTGNFWVDNDRGNSILKMNFTTIMDSAPEGFAPMYMKILVDGEIRQEMVIEKGELHSLAIPLQKTDRLVHLEVLSQETFSPQLLQIHSQDQRQLSFNFHKITLSYPPSLKKVHQMDLPSDTKGISYHIDVMKEDKDYIDISGWAFINEKNSDNSNIQLGLWSYNNSYLIDTLPVKRPDVTVSFKSLNFDDSGFSGLIAKSDIESGEYKLGIYITQDNTEAFQYTDKVIKIER